ncbi:MAG: CotH kinase family protein [Planctomycetota bacterium]
MNRFRLFILCFALFAAATGTGAESNLPVLEIQATKEIGSEPRVPCTVRMVSPKQIKDGNSDLLRGQIRFRGASSQGYDKKSFAFKLDESTRWLGLQKDRDWVLNAAFVDCSMMRHKLSYDLFQSLSVDGARRFAASSRFVEVNLNGRYHGVYLLMERVERSLLGLQRFNSSNTRHAVIYKAIDHGADFQQLGHGAYEQHEPEPEELEYWSPLEELNQFVSQAPNSKFFDAKSGIATRVDVDYAIDFHLLLLLTSNMDGNDKNFIIAQDAPTAAMQQPRFFFVPWDYDATFGRNWEGSVVEPREWLSNHLFDRLLGNRTYQQKYAARWKELRKRQFSVENISRMIDENAQTLGAAATRNERRWKGTIDANSGELTFAEDLKQMKAWVAARTKWLDAEIGRRTGR